MNDGLWNEEETNPKKELYNGLTTQKASVTFENELEASFTMRKALPQL